MPTPAVKSNWPLAIGAAAALAISVAAIVSIALLNNDQPSEVEVPAVVEIETLTAPAILPSQGTPETGAAAEDGVDLPPTPVPRPTSLTELAAFETAQEAVRVRLASPYALTFKGLVLNHHTNVVCGFVRIPESSNILDTRWMPWLYSIRSQTAFVFAEDVPGAMTIEAAIVAADLGCQFEAAETNP